MIRVGGGVESDEAESVKDVGHRPTLKAPIK